MFDVAHYLTANGRDPYQDWFDSLQDAKSQARIAVRIARLGAGAFGDCKPVGEGVYELRIHFGPGFRVYYARAGETLLLLLSGGDKSAQQRDIETAKAFWRDFREREG